MIKDRQKEIIIQFAHENKYFTTKDIEEILELKSSRVRFLLSELVTDDILLISIGENRNRKYKIKD